LLASSYVQLWNKVLFLVWANMPRDQTQLISSISALTRETWKSDLAMQRRVRTYGRRSTRIVYIDDAFPPPPNQATSVADAGPSTSRVLSSYHSHNLKLAKPSTSVANGLRKSSRALVVLSDSDSESDLPTNRQPLASLSPNFRRPQGSSRDLETTKPGNRPSSRRPGTRRPGNVVEISRFNESSDSEESIQRKSIKRSSTALSRLGARPAATSALRSSKPARATRPRRTTLATYDLSSDEDARTTSATHAPTTSVSETEASEWNAPTRPLKGGVQNRSSTYTRRTTTQPIVLSSSSDEDWQGVTSSSDERTAPVLAG
jgi:hypothetical protein